MVDFTNCKEEINEYKGSEKKKTLIYNNEKYLVKFPDPLRQKNKTISYINNSFSEYIGSHIFEMCGFKTQKTILGTFYINQKEKIVCACKDFTTDTQILYEFENFTNSTLVEKKVDTEIGDILNVINENRNIIDVHDTVKNFWEMFIVDALIGNTDRHNGNWGFIKDKTNGTVAFAPIFDCGSCLNPLLEDSDLEKLNDTELKNLALNCYSCLKENGKRINYFTYIASTKDEHCLNALFTIVKRIDMCKINNMIDEITCMSDVRKSFYKTILLKRYNMLNKIETEKEHYNSTTI